MKIVKPVMRRQSLKKMGAKKKEEEEVEGEKDKEEEKNR